LAGGFVAAWCAAMQVGGGGLGRAWCLFGGGGVVRGRARGVRGEARGGLRALLRSACALSPTKPPAPTPPPPKQNQTHPTPNPQTQNKPDPQPKLSSLDAGALARLLGCLAALRHEPDPAFMRAFGSEVNSKLPLFDDRWGL
jgi:hypothetical protein